MSFAVEMRGINKRFGDVQALSDVDLAVESGTIHALVGENGAGKTTLMRVLYGALASDSGQISLSGVGKRFSNTSLAIREGIGMVSQHYSIIPELTCLQNLILGAEPGWLIRHSAAVRRADELARQMGFSFEWNCSAAELSPAGAQKLEILKLLWRNARIMILDEPTAMLSPADSDALFGSLQQLTAGGATVILVTHRLPEVISHCKQVTVLRAGQKVGEAPVSQTSPASLAEMIVGHPMEKPEPRTATGAAGIRLQLINVSVKGYRGDEAVKGANLEVTRGELLGVAGVDGNGQRELIQALSGELNPFRGEMRWDGKDIAGESIGARIDYGFRLIPEDRHAEAIIDDWSLEENAALGLQRHEPFDAGPLINKSGRYRAAVTIADKLSTKHGGLQLPMSSLSGGNQQRFVAARALFLSPQLILAFQPARGLDIDATRRLYAAIRQECGRGACALIVSFDLDEILENCDRVVVMNDGRIAKPAAGQEHDRQAIGRLMVGAA